MDRTVLAAHASRNVVGRKKAGRWLPFPLASFLVASVCTIPGQAQNLYRDPAGNFTVQVPPGWQTQPQEDKQGISIVNTKFQSSVTVGVMRSPGSSTPSPEKELEDMQSQVVQDCPNARVKQRGSASLAGLSGVFFIVSCPAHGGEEVMKFAAASAPGLMIVLNSAVPFSDLGSVQSAMNSIERSIAVSGELSNSPIGASGSGAPINETAGNSRQLAALTKACSIGALSKEECDQRMASLLNHPAPSVASDQPQTMTSNDPNWTPGTGAPATSSTYRDNQGRYSLTVPEGWTATPESDGSGTLQLVRGSAWATVALTSADDSSQPADLNRAILQDLKPRYKHTALVNESGFTANGHPAFETDGSGIDSKGVRVSVMVVSIQAHGLDFLSVVASAPNHEAKETSDQMMRMLQSIRFGGQ